MSARGSSDGGRPTLPLHIDLRESFPVALPPRFEYSRPWPVPGKDVMMNWCGNPYGWKMDREKVMHTFVKSKRHPCKKRHVQDRDEMVVPLVARAARIFVYRERLGTWDNASFIWHRSSLAQGHHMSNQARVYIQILRFENPYGYSNPEMAVDTPKEYGFKRKIIELSME